jgi:type IV pilus assembly protein PilM
MSFLNDILGSFKGLSGDKSRSVLGIDIGSSSIKVVQLKRKGPRAVLETYGELSLGPYAKVPVGSATSLPQDKIIEALHDILTEKEVNITSNVSGIAIPFSSSLMSVIEMPQVSERQLAEMVPLEARKYIPVPISEVTLDWSVIPKSEVMSNDFEAEPVNNPRFGAVKKTSTVDVLVVAIHNDTLNRYADITKKNNLDVGFYEIEIFSTMRSVLEQTLEPVMIFDMGAASTKLFIVERGVLKVSHTINRGAQNITASISKSFGMPLDKAEVMKRELGLTSTTPEGLDVAKIVMFTLEYIFEEANRIVVSFEKKYNKNVSKVIMVGGGSSLKGLNEVAKKGFQTNVVSGDPFSKVVTPAFLEEVLRQTGPQFAVAVGLALRRIEEL